MRLTLILFSLLIGGFGVRAETLENDPARLPSQSLIEDFEKSFGIAPTGAARPLIKIAVELIKEFEGWVPYAYNDPAGYCTIGYGHLIALTTCDRVDLGDFAGLISRAAGETILLNDTITSRLAVHEYVTADLTPEQFGALSSFVFNIGKANFVKSTILKLINLNEHDLAAGEFARWVKAKGKVYSGLVARRACEEALFRGALALNSNGAFDRSDCVSLGVAPDVGRLIDIENGEN